MARIKILDLPGDMKVSREEMRKVFGGVYRKPNLGILKIAASDDQCKCGDDHSEWAEEHLIT